MSTHQSVTYYFENDIIKYAEQDQKYLDYMTSRYKTTGEPPPFSLDRRNKEIVLADSYVGILRIPSKLIVVRPRFYAFGFDIILTMWLFTRYSVGEGSPLLPTYDVQVSSFAMDICSIFVKEVKKLLQRGICGDYSSTESLSKFVKGKVNFAKSRTNPKKDEIYCCYDHFTVDTNINRAILYCLLFIQPILRDSKTASDLTSALNAFRGVALRKNFTTKDIDKIVLTRRTAHYQTVLDMCKMIIDHLSIAEIGTTVEFYSFLVDYNKLFEDFVWKLLREDFGDVISRWSNPKTFASYEDEYGTNEKHFLPDILYGYDPNRYSAKMVLDVKNKMGIFLNPDVFQISFYCDILKASQGVLIYPSPTFRRPRTITIKPLSGNGQLDLTAIFFNLSEMRKDFVSARRDFSNQMEQTITSLFS